MAASPTTGIVTPNIQPVAHFLLIYDRKAGKLVRKQEYATDAQALEARFAAEAEYGVRENIEIVAISAASEEELRKSHGRYFLTSEQLGQRLAAA
jgi:hypothetical protein